jgi:hypothetical protein
MDRGKDCNRAATVAIVPKATSAERCDIAAPEALGFALP